MRGSLIIILLTFCQALTAGQVNYSSIDHQSGVYTVNFDIEVNATMDTVRSIITDYENLHQLSDILSESTILNPRDSGPKQRLVVISVCLMIYCKDVKLVENIDEVNRDLVISRTVPRQSDFKSGEIRWRITPADSNRTRIEFLGQEEPAFWLPPVIGPVMVKHLLHDVALEVISNIESLSENGRFHPSDS